MKRIFWLFLSVMVLLLLSTTAISKEIKNLKNPDLPWHTDILDKKYRNPVPDIPVAYADINATTDYIDIGDVYGNTETYGNLTLGTLEFIPPDGGVFRCVDGYYLETYTKADEPNAIYLRCVTKAPNI